MTVVENRYMQFVVSCSSRSVQWSVCHQKMPLPGTRCLHGHGSVNGVQQASMGESVHNGCTVGAHGGAVAASLAHGRIDLDPPTGRQENGRRRDRYRCIAGTGCRGCGARCRRGSRGRQPFGCQYGQGAPGSRLAVATVSEMDRGDKAMPQPKTPAFIASTGRHLESAS
jgi:hypothetical protein